MFGRGGGLCGSIANRCEIVGNHSGNDGGGAYLCMLADCLVSGNSAANKGGYDAGGGMMYCRASRCTIVRNTVGEGTAFTETGGAGANSCVLDSCIVYENAYSTGAEGNAVACTATYSCFGSVVAGTGNIAADPKFVDAANGDFRLAADSPCIDAGNDASVRSATDLAGNERIFGRHVDMGAYENRDFFELAVEGVEVDNRTMSPQPRLVRARRPSSATRLRKRDRIRKRIRLLRTRERTRSGWWRRPRERIRSRTAHKWSSFRKR